MLAGGLIVAMASWWTIEDSVVNRGNLNDYLIVHDDNGSAVGIMSLRSGALQEIVHGGYALPSPGTGLVYVFEDSTLRAVDPANGRTVVAPVVIKGVVNSVGTATGDFHAVSPDGQRIYINVTIPDDRLGLGGVQCRDARDLRRVLGRIYNMKWIGLVVGELEPGVIAYITGQEGGRGVGRHRILDCNKEKIVAEVDLTIDPKDSPLDPVVYHGQAFANGKAYYFEARPGPVAWVTPPPGPPYVLVVEGNPPVITARRQLSLPEGWVMVGQAQVATEDGREIYLGLSTPDRRFGREIRALAVLDTATLALLPDVIELPEPVSDLAVRGRKVYGVGWETRQIIEVDGDSKVATRLPARVPEKRMGHLLGIK